MAVSPSKPCLTVIHLSTIFSNAFKMSTIQCVWPTALKLDCINNFDMLFLVMAGTTFLDKVYKPSYLA